MTSHILYNSELIIIKLCIRKLQILQGGTTQSFRHLLIVKSMRPSNTNQSDQLQLFKGGGGQVNLNHILIYAQLSLKHFYNLHGLTIKHDLLLCPPQPCITQAVPAVYFGMSTTEQFIQVGRLNTVLKSTEQHLSHSYGCHMVEAAQPTGTSSQNLYISWLFFFNWTTLTISRQCPWRDLNKRNRKVQHMRLI